MSKNTFKAIILKTNGDYEVKDVGSGEIREIIGGRMCYTYFNTDNQLYDIICHDEGKMLDLEVSCYVSTPSGIDRVCGDVIISKADEMGDQVDLTFYEIDMIIHYIKTELKQGKKPTFYWTPKINRKILEILNK